jgi:Tol biopolymer transport system component
MQVTRDLDWEGEPMISPDGTRVVYVSNSSGNSDVYVKDVLSSSILRLTNDEAMDFAPTWFPDGSAVAFVSERNGPRSVWKVGQFGGGATLLLSDAEYPAISPDGTRIAFSRTDGSAELRIWVAPLTDLARATKLTGSEHGLWDHKHVAWSPDGRTLSYSSQANLWVVPASGGTPRRLTLGNDGVGDSAWSSDGEYIYYDSWREGTLALWRIRRTGGTPRRLTQGTGFESEPSVSVDGSRFGYSTGDPGSGAVIADLDTGDQTTVGLMRSILLASLSPDGSRMVFVSERWDRRAELAEQSLDDGAPAGPPRRLTNQEGDATHPTYSPDGRWIAYYLIEGAEERDIWIIPSGGGQPVRFTDEPGRDVLPAWSPDGTRIAFMSQRAGTRDVWVAPVEDGMPTGEPTRLTNGSVAATFPVWSPDGSEIAFIGVKNGHLGIWIVPAGGVGQPRLLTDGVDATNIRWDAGTGNILAAATCGEERRSLWTISPVTGDVAPLEPAIVFGSERAYGTFDVSSQGRLVVFSLDDPTGDVWVSEGPPGTY